MVIVATGNFKTKVLRKSYPVEEGLEAGTTKQTKDRRLQPSESFVTEEVRGS